MGLCSFVSFLYNYKVISSALIFDVLKYLDDLDELTVGSILRILKRWYYV